MSVSFRKVRIIAAVLLCTISLFAAALLFAAVARDYDARIHHFTADSTLATAAAALTIAGVLLALIFAVLARVGRATDAPAFSIPGVFTATFLGFLLILTFLLDIASAADWFTRIRLGMMALSAFTFLITVQKNATLSPIASLLSLAPIVYAFLSVLYIYFDGTMGMNAPLKAYYLMMYLAMSLFFTGETRATLERVHTPSYCLFAGLAVVLCGAVGLSHVALSLCGMTYLLSLREAVIALATALFAAVRLFTLAPPAAQSAPTEEVSA